MILLKISSYLYFDEAVALVADEPLCPLFDNPWFFKWLNRHFACKRKKIEQIFSEYCLIFLNMPQPLCIVLGSITCISFLI